MNSGSAYVLWGVLYFELFTQALQCGVEILQIGKISLALLPRLSWPTAWCLGKLWLPICGSCSMGNTPQRSSWPWWLVHLLRCLMSFLQSLVTLYFTSWKRFFVSDWEKVLSFDLHLMSSMIGFSIISSSLNTIQFTAVSWRHIDLKQSNKSWLFSETSKSKLYFFSNNFR